jgi:alkanesulfonate monooxygenase SsuD/methylene tetrahydromethanopterin reductase-like flavin-dependent oxidoreductase (luciferase family)
VRVGVQVRSPGIGFEDAAAKAEAEGFDSLWFGVDDTDDDPIVMAAAAAAVTSRVGLVVALGDPTPVTAKAVASLDALSGGRVRIVVDTRRGIELMRAMLSGGRVNYETAGIVDAPVLPGPAQDHVPVWTCNPELAAMADGVVVEEGAEVAEERVALLIEGAESLGSRVEAARRRGVEEIVLSPAPALWETVGRVLRDPQDHR